MASVASDGHLVVRRDQPLSPTRECIHGLLTALHIQLDHTSRHQLHSVTQRYFYALDMDKAIEEVTASCQNFVYLLATHPIS